MTLYLELVVHTVSNRCRCFPHNLKIVPVASALAFGTAPLEFATLFCFLQFAQEQFFKNNGTARGGLGGAKEQGSSERLKLNSCPSRRMGLCTRGHSNVSCSTSVTTQVRWALGLPQPFHSSSPGCYFIPALLKPQIPLPPPPRRMTLLCTSTRNEETSQSLPPAPACPHGWATPTLPQASASICVRVHSFSST